MKHSSSFPAAARIILLLALSMPSYAGWIQTNGPSGGKVTCFAGQDGFFYAGTHDGGIFRSSDDGRSWTAVNTGLTCTRIHALAVNGSQLFTGSDEGVFISNDNGQNWTSANAGLTTLKVTTLFLHDSYLFAGTDGGGVFRSSDNGQSWNAFNANMNSIHIYSFAAIGSNFFAGTNGGVFVTTNDGGNWQTVKTGLTHLVVYSLAADQSTLYAGTYGGGVFKTTNNGTLWTEVNNNLGMKYVNALAVRDGNLFAGTAGGGVWRRPLSEMIPPAASGRVVTHTGEGGPGSLRQALTDANEHAGPDTIRFAIPDSDPEYHDGIFTIRPSGELPRITDGNLLIDGFSQAQFMGADANPWGPEIEIAGDLAGDVNGMWIDAGNVEIQGLAINRFKFAGIVIQRGDNGRISGCHFGTDAQGEHAAGNGGNGILFYGNTKNYRIDPYLGNIPGNVISGNAVSGIMLNRACSRVLISGNFIGLDRSGNAAIGNQFQGISMSSGCGSNEVSNNWIGGNGAEGIYLFDSHINTIANNYIGTNEDFAPGLGNGAGGVYLSVSAENQLIGNLIWNNGGDGVRLEGETANHNRITQNSIWHNTHKGINNTFGANDGIAPPRFMEVAPEIVCGLTSPGNGVDLFTDDGGQGKIHIGSTQADAAGEFCISPAGQELLTYFTATATDESGNTSEFSQAVKTAVRKTDAESPEKFALYPNYPNPFNPQTRIPFDVPGTFQVRIQVYNILGDKITELKNGRIEAGHHEIVWTGIDAKGVRMPNGIYIVKMSAGEFEAMQKCALLKKKQAGISQKEISHPPFLKP